MKEILSSEIITPELMEGAILNEEYHGFKEDYSVLHCLIRKHNIKSMFEVGTNMGTGTKIMKNAMGEDSQMFSLDLPTELAHISLQHPINEGKGDSVGHRCDLPYTQLRGDSLKFDYTPYKTEGWFIDGEHDYQHPFTETQAAIENEAKLIIYHDSDMPEVYRGIVDAFEYASGEKPNEYVLFRVIDTRIAFAIHKSLIE